MKKPERLSVPVSVMLSPWLVKRIDEAVKSGAYASRSHFIRWACGNMVQDCGSVVVEEERHG